MDNRSLVHLMQAALPASQAQRLRLGGLQDLEHAPAPEASNVKCKRNEGGLYAVAIFGGNATSDNCQQKVSELRCCPSSACTLDHSKCCCWLLHALHCSRGFVAHLCRQTLKQDAVSATADDWVLARYNDPSTKSFFRRNEVMVQLADFDLWKDAQSSYKL